MIDTYKASTHWLKADLYLNDYSLAVAGKLWRHDKAVEARALITTRGGIRAMLIINGTVTGLKASAFFSLLETIPGMPEQFGGMLAILAHNTGTWDQITNWFEREEKELAARYLRWHKEERRLEKLPVPECLWYDDPFEDE